MKLGLLIVIVGTIILSACSSGPGMHDALAQCLTDNGVVMYGTEWCPHCANQKKLFGKSFKLVTYVDCDANRNACNNAGVTSYPTWVFDETSRTTGTQQLFSLAEDGSCVDEYLADVEGSEAQ